MILLSVSHLYCRLALPRLTGQSERLLRLRGTEQYLSSVENLHCEISDLLQKLYHWRWRWEADWGNCVYQILPSRNITQAFDDDGFPLFESLFWYSDIERASEILIYDTALMLFKYLHIILNLPEGPAPPCPPNLIFKDASTLSPLLLPGQAQSAKDCALEICRSLDHHMLPAHAGPGALDMLAPVRFASSNLEKGSKVSLWLEKLSHKIADNIGYELSRYMTGSRSVLLNASDPLSQIYKYPGRWY